MTLFYEINIINNSRILCLALMSETNVYFYNEYYPFMLYVLLAYETGLESVSCGDCTK